MSTTSETAAQRKERVEVERLVFFWRLAFKNRADAYPVIADWVRLGGDVHWDADFVIDGQRYVVIWKYERYGSDRAHWDDGWWPEFFAVVARRRGLVPWRRRTFVPIYWASGDRTLESQLAELVS